MKKIYIGQILQKSFQIAFKEWKVIYALFLPVILSLVLFSISIPLLIFSIYPIYLPTILLTLALIIVSLWFLAIGIGGIVLAVETINKKQKVQFWETINQSTRNSWRLLSAYLLEESFISLGLLLFIIPGIFLAVKLSLVVPGCILEKKGLGIKRSWNVTKGNFWKIFLILIIWNVLFIVLGLLPYLSIINILLIPVYLTTLTLIYMQLRKSR